MKIRTHKAKVFGSDCEIDLMHFDAHDRKQWKKLFDDWKTLKMGMRNYKAREPNFPEGLSEVAFCLYTGSARFVSLRGKAPRSFDTFNLKAGRAEQIKASSIAEDLTSFGPKSRWDDLYFLDFYNEGKLDGTFNAYKIPTELIKRVKVARGVTFLKRQREGKRPRFSITKELIKKGAISPIGTNVKIW